MMMPDCLGAGVYVSATCDTHVGGRYVGLSPGGLLNMTFV
jgi:hypothetical protein